MVYAANPEPEAEPEPEPEPEPELEPEPTPEPNPRAEPPSPPWSPSPTQVNPDGPKIYAGEMLASMRPTCDVTCERSVLMRIIRGVTTRAVEPGGPLRACAVPTRPPDGVTMMAVLAASIPPLARRRRTRRTRCAAAWWWWTTSDS